MLPHLKAEQKKEARENSAFVRSLGVCAARGMHNLPCCQNIQSCHVRLGSNAGMGTKPMKREVPMCYQHHRLQSDIGERRFWGDLLEKAIELGGKISEAKPNRDLALWHLFGWK